LAVASLPNVNKGAGSQPELGNSSRGPAGTGANDMIVHRSEAHANEVEAWEKRNAASVSPDLLPQLYAKAIQAIHRRSLANLSGITMLVVLDRAIHEVAERHPSLLEIKAGSEAVDFGNFFRRNEIGSAQLSAALRDLLIAVLTVIGNITADVLTKPLHDELMTVTTERTLVPAQTTLRSMSGAKNREQK
jgi:hypothetical protein